MHKTLWTSSFAPRAIPVGWWNWSLLCVCEWCECVCVCVCVCAWVRVCACERMANSDEGIFTDCQNSSINTCHIFLSYNWVCGCVCVCVSECVRACLGVCVWFKKKERKLHTNLWQLSFSFFLKKKFFSSSWYSVLYTSIEITNE